MCTNKVAIETHSRTRGAKRRAFGAEGPLSRSPSLERSERRGGLLFVVPVDSPVDSTFERSENFAIAHTVSSSSCCNEGCGQRDNRVKVRPRLHLRMRILTNASFKFICDNGDEEMILYMNTKCD